MTISNNRGKRSRSPRGPGPRKRFIQQTFAGQGVSLPELQQEGPARTSSVIQDRTSGHSRRDLETGLFPIHSAPRLAYRERQIPHKCCRGTSCSLLKMGTLHINDHILQIRAGGGDGLNLKSAHASSNSISNSKSNYTSHFVRGRKRPRPSLVGNRGCQKSETLPSGLKLCSEVEHRGWSLQRKGGICKSKRLHFSAPRTSFLFQGDQNSRLYGFCVRRLRGWGCA